MVTLDELAKAGSKMRKAQKEFFLLKGNRRLNDAKQAENEFDRLLLLMASDNLNRSREYGRTDSSV